jgi:hypothetical protein
VAFVLRAILAPSDLPELRELLDDVGQRLGEPVELDPESARASERGERASSWCPWAVTHVGCFVPGRTTRGADLSVESVGGDVEVRITAPALGTWTDWRLAMELGCAFARRAPQGVLAPGEGRHAETSLRETFGGEEVWQGELRAGAGRLLGLIDEGRLVRVGGPAGFAVIGPRTLAQLVPEATTADDLPQALLTRIQDVISGWGFEDFHEANPLCLDGREGREIIACVVAAEKAVLLRDPEYLLLSQDLEAPSAELLLLPFSRIDEVFPGRVRWLDDRTCGLTAMPRPIFQGCLEAAAPLLVGLPELLDGGAAPPPAPAGAWWKFW